MAKQSDAFNSKQIVLFIFGVVFIIGIILVIIYIPCPENAQYQVFKVALALAAAGIAAIIPGFFHFKFKSMVSSGGALAVFAFVYLYNFNSSEGGHNCFTTLNLYFYSDSAKSEIITSGYIRVFYEQREENIQIGPTGKATINEIPLGYVGREFKVNPKIPGHIENQLTLVFPKEKNIELVIPKKQVSTRIHGKIRYKDLPFNGIIAVNNHRDSVRNGIYDFDVPLAQGTSAIFTIIKNDSILYNKSEIIADYENIIPL